MTKESNNSSSPAAPTPVAAASAASTRVEIFTDGACSGNPGPGGWGALLRYKGHERELSGGEKDTTNNRMELLAAIRALESLNRPCEIDLYTDSQYVRNGITQWLARWKQNGWRTAAKAAVKNADLWQQLDRAVQQHRIQWHWVRGHNGHAENERVDRLARAAVGKTR